MRRCADSTCPQTLPTALHKRRTSPFARSGCAGGADPTPSTDGCVTERTRCHPSGRCPLAIPITTMNRREVTGFGSSPLAVAIRCACFRGGTGRRPRGFWSQASCRYVGSQSVDVRGLIFHTLFEFPMRLHAMLLSLVLVLAACGGGDDSSDSGGPSASSGGGGSTQTGTYYRRTNGTTAIALNGGSSSMCSWADCPGGATCGVRLDGVENGSNVVFQIPTSSGSKVPTTFQIERTGSGVTLWYQGSRAGDYTPVSSWADAVRGDQGYCGGTGGSSGGSGSGGSSGATTGRIMVFLGNGALSSAVTVTIDGATAGTLTSYFSGTPTCGAAGTITRTVSLGGHTVSARNSEYSWAARTVNVTAGGCTAYELR